MAKRFDTRTILIVLLVLLIIAAAYIVITNLPAEERYIYPEDVTGNPSQYLNQTISVRGYFIYDGNTPVIVSTTSTTAGKTQLKMDLTLLSENQKDNLTTGSTLYIFTGVLKQDLSNPLTLDVYLEVTGFRRF